MVDAANGPDEAALAVVARHALHDEELVVALATGSLDETEERDEIARARSFVERCTACRELHDDIAAIGAAVRADARGSLPAPRDFRLTVEDARRLGGPVSAGGFVAALRRSMLSFARPIGASMAALGVVGLLVGSVSLGGGAASLPSSAGTGLAAESRPPAEVQTGPQQSGGPKASDRTAVVVPDSTDDATGNGNESPRDSAFPGVNPAVWLLGGSVALLVAGLGLVVLAIRRNH